MQQDIKYLDTDKYLSSGAYHWKNYLIDKDYREYIDLLVKRILERTAPKEPIIDFGCGDGLITYLVRKGGRSINGYDIDKVAIKLANKIDPKTKHYSKYPKQHYQHIILADVFEHLNQENLNFLYNIIGSFKYIFFVNPESESEYHYKVYSDLDIMKIFNRKGFEEIYLLPIAAVNKSILIFRNQCI